MQAYITAYWDEARVKPRVSKWGTARNLLMHIGLIRLPHPTVSPNNGYFAGTQYYWDSYFTILGLIDAGKQDIAKGMVDNLLFLFQKFGYMPARNSLTSIGRTQPPFLTRMAWEVYESGAADQDWLNEVMTIAELEYQNVWCSGRRLHGDSGLSRYRPRFLKKILTVYESGWDVSSRFALGRTSVLPVDLNCLLYQYEKDIAAWYQIQSKDSIAKSWSEKATSRACSITAYFWDEESGFFYDFDTVSNKRDELKTLAGFFPLWCGAATKAQAEASIEHLSTFEQPYGLTTTEKVPWNRRQWDYPNAWPPLQLILIDGLRNYGYREKARSLTTGWLKLQENVYKKTGKMWEKYDVVRGRKGKRGRYPTQAGFSWTNGVYLRLLKYNHQDNHKHGETA